MEKGNLSEKEKKIVQALSTGRTYEEVKALLAETGVRIHCLDDTGMTFLQHAAFRGKAALCELLLAQGADVNSNHHDNNYSTLMFAALSGSVETTRLILEAGANISHENNLSRTATQMAAFVGQHACVSLINNFVPVSELEYYTVPQGLETEGKLRQNLVKPLYNLLNISNLHPVYVSMFLDKHRGLLDDRYRVVKVLDHICEKSMKSRETNDVKALKSHYMTTLLTAAGKWVGEKGGLDKWLKMLVKGRASDGFPENQEQFLRGALKEFPYMESQLLQQLVHNIAPVAVGDDPTALSMIMSGINGQQFFKDEDSACMTCGQGKATKKCSACKMVKYCDATCQRLHWSTHKLFCQKLAVKYGILEAEKEKSAKEEEEKKKQEELDKETKLDGTDEDKSQDAEVISDKNRLQGGSSTVAPDTVVDAES